MDIKFRKCFYFIMCFQSDNITIIPNYELITMRTAIPIKERDVARKVKIVIFFTIFTMNLKLY